MKKRNLKKEILKEILDFKSEFFLTALMLTLFILSFIYVGFDNIWNIGFNICLFICIPATFIGIKTCREMLYEVWIGKRKDENK